MYILRLTTPLPKPCQLCQSATLAEKKEQAFSQMPAQNITIKLINYCIS